LQEALLSPLTAWHTFYGIIGAAAATLMGLMFVVITLIAGVRARVASSSGVAIFNTPSVVHFSAALFVAALLSAPWQALWPAGLLLGLAGLGGAAYTNVVFWRVRRRQMTYQLVLEDWLWHIILPLIAYTGLVVAAILLEVFATPALFVIAAAAVLFLFIGIHNAWDNVTYTVITLSPSRNQGQG
jgi:hypothetical protein